MLPLLTPADCPIDPLRGLRVAILGYGNQGAAHARNLRDSGVQVHIGARTGGSGAAHARVDGFTVHDPIPAGRDADVAVILTPDETHADLLRALHGGGQKAIAFAHGFCLRFQDPPLDPEWDVFVVAPAAPGVQLRQRFLEGSGVPALLAVHQDASGQAGPRARAYAAALGCARAGVFLVQAAAEAEVDLFGEQAVLCGGMAGLVTAAFDTLVAAGYPDEMAYLECVQQLRLTTELVERFGVEGMRRRISPTALYGDLTRGPRVIDASARERLAEILEEIRSGRFAAEWLDTVAERPDWAREDLARARNPRLEAAGERVRAVFPGEGKGVDTRGGAS